MKKYCNEFSIAINLLYDHNIQVLTKTNLTYLINNSDGRKAINLAMKDCINSIY